MSEPSDPQSVRTPLGTPSGRTPLGTPSGRTPLGTPSGSSSSPATSGPSSDAAKDASASGKRSSGLPAFAYPIPIGLVLMIVWGTLAAMLVAPTGSGLMDEVTNEGTATVSGCHPAWQSLGRTTKCQAEITWQNGSGEHHEITSVGSIRDGERVQVVERWTFGDLNTNTGQYQRNTRELVTADHPHRHGLTDGVWFWGIVGALVILVLMIIACTVIGRVGARREHQRRLHQIMNRGRTEESAPKTSTTDRPSGRGRRHDERI